MRKRDKPTSTERLYSRAVLPGWAEYDAEAKQIVVDIDQIAAATAFAANMPLDEYWLDILARLVPGYLHTLLNRPVQIAFERGLLVKGSMLSVTHADDYLQYKSVVEDTLKSLDN